MTIDIIIYHDICQNEIIDKTAQELIESDCWVKPDTYNGIMMLISLGIKTNDYSPIKCRRNTIRKIYSYSDSRGGYCNIATAGCFWLDKEHINHK